MPRWPKACARHAAVTQRDGWGPVRTGFSPQPSVILRSMGAGLATGGQTYGMQTRLSPKPLGQGHGPSETRRMAVGCGGPGRRGLHYGLERSLSSGRGAPTLPPTACTLALRCSPPLGKTSGRGRPGPEPLLLVFPLPPPGGMSFSAFLDLPPRQAPGPAVYPEPGPVASGSRVSGRLCQGHVCLGL